METGKTFTTFLKSCDSDVMISLQDKMQERSKAQLSLWRFLVVASTRQTMPHIYIECLSMHVRSTIGSNGGSATNSRIHLMSCPLSTKWWTRDQVKAIDVLVCLRGTRRVQWNSWQLKCYLRHSKDFFYTHASKSSTKLLQTHRRWFHTYFFVIDRLHEPLSCFAHQPSTKK